MKQFKAFCIILLLLAAIFTMSSAMAEKTITLTFTGDCTIGSEEATRLNDDSFDSLVKAKGYDYFFANYRSLFEQDDLTIINFEGVLSDSKTQESRIKRYRFRGPTEFVKILTGSSIEACSLANNHIADFGTQGAESTRAALEENGIAWFQQYHYYMYEKDGIKIAFVSLHNIWNEFEKVKALLLDLKENQGANAIVVCWHAGREYRGGHETNVERTSQAMVKYGADLIIMHHPHVLQGMNVSKNRCIFYSVGNFVFGGNSRIKTEKFKLKESVTSLYSIVVRAKLTFTNNGRYLGQQVTLYPTYNTSGAMDKDGQQINNYQPFRADAEQAVPVRYAIQRDSTYQMPEITTDADGLSLIELPYMPAFDNIVMPEDDGTDGMTGAPEASSPNPTRDSKAQ